MVTDQSPKIFESIVGVIAQRLKTFCNIQKQKILGGKRFLKCNNMLDSD